MPVDVINPILRPDQLLDPHPTDFIMELFFWQLEVLGGRMSDFIE